VKKQFIFVFGLKLEELQTPGKNPNERGRASYG